MAPSPLIGTDMLLKSMKFLLLKNLETSSYKKGRSCHLLKHLCDNPTNFVRGKSMLESGKKCQKSIKVQHAALLGIGGPEFFR